MHIFLQKFLYVFVVYMSIGLTLIYLEKTHGKLLSGENVLPVCLHLSYSFGNSYTQVSSDLFLKTFRSGSLYVKSDIEILTHFTVGLLSGESEGSRIC